MQEDLIPIPMSAHSELTASARESLTGKWGNAALVSFVYFIILMFVSIIPFGSMVVGGPLSVGFASFASKIGRSQGGEIGDLIINSDKMINSLAAYILYSIGIGFAMILLIIPGIILAIGWGFTFFILAEEENIDPIEALKKSWRITNGYKWDLFVFSLRFIPWIILAILTIGIGFIWLMPYMQVCYFKYYQELVEDIDDPTAFDATDHLIEY